MEPAIKIWGQAPSPFAELPAASNSGCSRWYSLPPRILTLHFDYMTELREQLVNERGLLHLRKIVLSQGKLGRPSQLEEVCQKFHHHHLRVFHLCQVFRCAGYKKTCHKPFLVFTQTWPNVWSIHPKYARAFAIQSIISTGMDQNNLPSTRPRTAFKIHPKEWPVLWFHWYPNFCGFAPWNSRNEGPAMGGKQNCRKIMAYQGIYQKFRGDQKRYHGIKLTKDMSWVCAESHTPQNCKFNPENSNKPLDYGVYDSWTNPYQVLLGWRQMKRRMKWISNGCKYHNHSAHQNGKSALK